ncbi:MAG: hypothetical protein JSV91_11185 [Phycisphaerales bacterium]|nr:MAG: hypothetical protein JSV91_11185 [Phycisphaerales bacterium]
MALMDAIIGGVMLGVGLAAIISIASRSLAVQADSEKRMQAAWLADELLAMVLVEGPRDYAEIHETSDHFDDPFAEYNYDVDIEDQGFDQPYKVTVTVRWGDLAERPRDYVRVETLIAQPQYTEEQLDDERYKQRAPLEPVDRESRWYGDEMEY